MAARLETQNEFYKGAVAGTMATLAKYLFVQIAKFLGITFVDNNYTAYETVLENFYYSVPTVLFALVEAMIDGAFFGVILAFVFTKVFTQNHYLFKGLAFGAALWVFNWGVMERVFRYPKVLEHSLADAVVFGISYLIYGGLTAYFLKRMGIFSDLKKG